MRHLVKALVLQLGLVGLSIPAVAFAARAANAGEMVLIPAGPFTMGNDRGLEDERPEHQIVLREFFIDRNKVTNGQFARFLNNRGIAAAAGQRWYDVDDNDARIHRHGDAWRPDLGHESHPAVEVSWYGALAYCSWQGKRLPREPEWEKAARGNDRRKFPWGNDPPDKTRAHFGGGWNELKPVGSFPKGASPYGVLDMAGNGWEWVSSAYRPYPYDERDGREDLKQEVIRGTRGGGHDARPQELTATHRGVHVSRNPRGGHHNISFRCAL
jgi:formylglycine-generating enzyme required for sulfatase activity